MKQKQKSINEPIGQVKHYRSDIVVDWFDEAPEDDDLVYAAPVFEEMRRLRINSERYEKLRCLNFYQFEQIFKRNIPSGTRFDELVDKLKVE